METNALSSSATNAPAIEGFQDVLPPLESLPTPFPWLWILLGIAIAALSVWLFRYMSRVRSQENLVAEPAIAPHERALTAMRDAMPFVDNPKEFLSRVSDALRLYLEERFALRAPDRTTEEFLQDLVQDATLSGNQKNSLEVFLSQCDLVKFARHHPTRNELYELYDSAVVLVQETVERPVEGDIPGGES